MVPPIEVFFGAVTFYLIAFYLPGMLYFTKVEFCCLNWRQRSGTLLCLIHRLILLMSWQAGN